MKVTIDIKELFELKKLHGKEVIPSYFESIIKESLIMLAQFEKTVKYPYVIKAMYHDIVIEESGNTEFVPNEEM